MDHRHASLVVEVSCKAFNGEVRTGYHVHEHAPVPHGNAPAFEGPSDGPFRDAGEIS